VKTGENAKIGDFMTAKKKTAANGNMDKNGKGKTWRRTLRGRLKRGLGRTKIAKGSTEEKVYNFVCKNPGMCTYMIEKKMGMSGGRVRHALQQLNDTRLIKFKFVRTSPRIKKLSYPVEAWKLVPHGLKKVVRKVVLKK